MSKKLNPIQEIRNYFYNIYQNHECCSNESKDCLTAYWQYIQTINNFGEDWCNVNIRLTKILDKYASAMIETEDDYHFHVKLPKELSNIHTLKDIDDIVRLFVLAGHEFQHIVQTFLSPVVMEEYMIFLSKADVDKIKFSHEDNISSRKFKHLKNGYLFDAEFLSTLEKDADKKTHEYFTRLLDEIISNEEDCQFISFLNTMIDYSDTIDKIRRRDYLSTQNHYDQVVRILTRLYNIKKDELIIP